MYVKYVDVTPTLEVDAPQLHSVTEIVLILQ